MPEERLEERTEPATPRRRREARERGHVARSADLSAAGVLLGAVLALEFLGRPLVEGLAASAAGILGRLEEAGGSPEALPSLLGGAVAAAFLGLLPFVAVVAAAAAGINLLQVGFLWTGRPMRPQPERLDPAAGLRRLLSGRSLARVAAGILKAGAVAAVVLATLWSERLRLAGLAGLELPEALRTAAGLVFLLFLRASLALLGLGILDWGYQRWQYERDLRMSRAEVREELKRYEGDPRIRERRRAVQRQMALQRMLLRLPRATVVVVHSDRLSVALEYDERRMEAPLVSVKGSGRLAIRIHEQALEHGIPVVERGDLARDLYRRVEPGGAVPPDLYGPVAEVVACAYRLRNLAAVA